MSAIKTLQDQELEAAQAAGEEFFLDIPDGWAFYTADFSCVASGLHATGNVTLVRDQAGKAAWHKITAGIEDVESAPPLYVFGRGRTLSEAIASAVVEAAAASSAGSQKEQG